jgi:hypothetical protein
MAILKSSAERRFVHLGLAEARFYFGCRGHMHTFRRVGYRSGAFDEDAPLTKVLGPRGVQDLHGPNVNEPPTYPRPPAPPRPPGVRPAQNDQGEQR